MIEGMELLGRLAAELLEEIEQEDVPDGHSATIATVAIVVDMSADDGEGGGANRIKTRCSDDRRWVQEGLLDAGRRIIRDSTTYIDEDDD